MILVYLGIALGFSFLCSVLEAVLLSITPAYVAGEEARGTTFGVRLMRLKSDIDRPLAAILTLNTFAHTIGAAGVGAEAQAIWGERSLAAVSAVVTVLILVASEIVPKTLGAVYWRRLARPSVTTIRILIVALWPFVWLSQLLTRLLRGGERPGVLSREDIRNLIHAGHRRGIVRRDEKVIIDNLMNFGEVAVTDIMTPRDKIVALPSSTPIREVGPGSPAWLVSRIPIHGGDLDAIEGYVLKDEILARHVERRVDGTVAEIRRELETVRDDLAMPALYQALVEASEHIAIVRDRDGRTVGLVTMENLFEAMLGVEIVDEEDHRRHGGE